MSIFLAHCQTDIGRRRQINQDVVGIFQTPKGKIAIVCDGMGGHTAGEYAAQTALTAIAQHFKTHPNPTLNEAFELAQAQLEQQIRHNTYLDGMGTTAVVLLLEKERATFAHVGDSRIYFFHNQTLQQLSKDHTLVQELLDQNAITPNQALTHPKKHILLRALGTEYYQPDVVSLDAQMQAMQVGDMFLLCSDGLYNELELFEIEGILLNFNLDIQTKVEYLLRQANEKGGSDNISVILIEKIA
jgi:PPM family protein phosphatase